MLVAIPLDVKGQEDGADIVGNALAHSIIAGLSGVRDLEATVAERAGAGTTHTLEGVLERRQGAALLNVLLRRQVDGEVLWESGEHDIGTDLSRAASELGRDIAAAMGLVYPSRYPYINDFNPGERLAASPLYAEFLEAGSGDHALEVGAQLVEAFPDDPAVHVLHAWALMLAWDAAPNENTLAELRERLTSLARVDPSSPYDDLIRAYVYRSSGEPGQARVVYSWVLDGTELAPAARAWALRQRALAGLQVGDAESARRDAQEAATLDPSKPENHIALSKALEEVGLLDEAADASRQALALASHWRHHQRLGLVYSRAGRFEPATEALRSACELGNSQEACANLAVILGRAGDAAAAHVAAEHAESLSGTPWGAYNLACYRSRSGDLEGAVRELRRALELGYADKLVTTDPDLDALRELQEFKEVSAAIEERITTRREQSSSIFPWQS